MKYLKPYSLELATFYAGQSLVSKGLAKLKNLNPERYEKLRKLKQEGVRRAKKFGMKQKLIRQVADKDRKIKVVATDKGKQLKKDLKTAGLVAGTAGLTYAATRPKKEKPKRTIMDEIKYYLS